MYQYSFKCLCLLGCSVHKGVNNCLHIEFLEVRVLLTNTDKNNRFASGVHHIQSRSNLFINRIKLCHDDSINALWIVTGGCRIKQSLVDFVS